MASLTLHLVTWNGAKYLPHLFASLREQTMQEWALVVVDNGSRDDTVAVLEKELTHFRTKMRKEIRMVCNAENRGFAGGHNQAFGNSMCRHCESAKQSHTLRTIAGGEIASSRTPRNDDLYIQLLNQDTVLASDYLEKLAAFLDAHPDVGAVQGALCRWDFAGDMRTDTIDTLGLQVRRTRQVVEAGAGEPFTDYAVRLTPPMEVFGVSGALPMYRWSAVESVALPVCLSPSNSPSALRSRGLDIASPVSPLETASSCSFSWVRLPLRGEGEGQTIEIFDSSFFSYKEDVDLAYRLRSAGWKAYCVPAARAWHDRTAGVHRTRRQRSLFERRLSWRNHLLMLIANEHWRTFARDWWRIIGYEIGKIAYIIAREPRTLAALPSLFWLLPGAIKKRKQIMRDYRVWLV